MKVKEKTLSLEYKAGFRQECDLHTTVDLMNNNNGTARTAGAFFFAAIGRPGNDV